jgi:hypothetical protein
MERDRTETVGSREVMVSVGAVAGVGRQPWWETVVEKEAVRKM